MSITGLQVDIKTKLVKSRLWLNTSNIYEVKFGYSTIHQMDSELGVSVVRYVKWSDFPARRKHKVWDMLEKIGDEVIVVTGNGLNKHGVSRSAGLCGAATGRVLVVVYTSKNMVRVRFASVV